MKAIGLCMIVKDEARLILRCLESVRPLVDYFLIEDTGSTDGTQALIRGWLDRGKLPGEVFEEPWQDFARNRSVALARLRKQGEIDYAFMIDADDTLVCEPGFDPKAFKTGLDADLYYAEIRRGPARHHRPQLCSNRVEFCYRGVLHEFMQGPAGHSSGTAAGFHILSGIEGARSADPDKYRKDAALLEHALETESDPFLRSRYTFYLANSWKDYGDAEKALTAYLERVRLGFWEEEIFISLCCAAQLKARLDHPDHEVIGMFLRAYETCPRRAEALHGAARYCRAIGKHHQGYMFAKRGLDIKEPESGLFVEPWVYEYGLLDEFAVNAYWVERYDECLDACERLLRGGNMPEDMRERVEMNARFSREKLATNGSRLINQAGRRFNLGCGAQHLPGWVNVDKRPQVQPDVLHDLETFPWPFEDSSADEILLNHVLEHLGGGENTILNVFKELYRICKPGAKVVIRVPDPRHDDFFGDPTHIRPIHPNFFQTLDLSINENWQSRGLPGTALAKYLEIDFKTERVVQTLDDHWRVRVEAGKLTQDELAVAIRSQNNVVQSNEIVLSAIKPFSPGRSLLGIEAVVVQRWSGLGDVLMAVAALSAIKSSIGIKTYLITSPELLDFVSRCSGLDKAFTAEDALREHLCESGIENIKRLDWSPAGFGISRLHQIDAFLMSLGLTLPDSGKTLMVRSDLSANSAIATRIKELPEGYKRVVVHPGVSDPNRTWPVHFWSDLVERLSAAGHVVLVIGKKTGNGGVHELTATGVVDLTDQLDLASTLHLLRNCDLLISSDSGPIQLAGASDIAIIGLYSVAPGSARLPFRDGSAMHKAVAIAPACEFHPCYRQMDPETVSRFCAEESILDTDISRLFANWCVNLDRFACTREASTLDKVMAAVERLL